METVRNTLLTIVVSAILLSCVFHGVYLGISDGMDSEYSDLEARQLHVVPELTQETLSEGKFQDSAESFVADLVPQRESVVLANAALQRISIRQMAFVNGFDLYPTFFNSDFAYHPETDAIYSMSQDREYLRPYLENSSDAINAMVASNEDVRFFLYAPVRGNYFPYEDINYVLSEPYDEEFLNEVFYDRLDDSIGVVRPLETTFQEYRSHYFRSDHHWNFIGAYQAYCAIMKEMGFEDEILPHGELMVFDKVPFYGSWTRESLMKTEEPDYIVDYEFDFPNYSTYLGDTEKGDDFTRHTETFINGDISSSIFAHRHDEYFRSGTGNTVLTFVNDDLEDGDSLLLIDDSFGKGVETLFLSHYKTVYVIDPRRYDMTVSEFLESHENVDDVLVLLSLSVTTQKAVGRHLS